MLMFKSRKFISIEIAVAERSIVAPENGLLIPNSINTVPSILYALSIRFKNTSSVEKLKP